MAERSYNNAPLGSNTYGSLDRRTQNYQGQMDSTLYRLGSLSLSDNGTMSTNTTKYNDCFLQPQPWSLMAGRPQHEIQEVGEICDRFKRKKFDGPVSTANNSNSDADIGIPPTELENHGLGSHDSNKINVQSSSVPSHTWKDDSSHTTTYVPSLWNNELNSMSVVNEPFEGTQELQKNNLEMTYGSPANYVPFNSGCEGSVVDKSQYSGNIRGSNPCFYTGSGTGIENNNIPVQSFSVPRSYNGNQETLSYGQPVMTSYPYPPPNLYQHMFQGSPVPQPNIQGSQLFPNNATQIPPRSVDLKIRSDSSNENFNKVNHKLLFDNAHQNFPQSYTPSPIPHGNGTVSKSDGVQETVAYGQSQMNMSSYSPHNTFQNPLQVSSTSQSNVHGPQPFSNTAPLIPSTPVITGDAEVQSRSVSENISRLTRDYSCDSEHLKTLSDILQAYNPFNSENAKVSINHDSQGTVTCASSSSTNSFLCSPPNSSYGNNLQTRPALISGLGKLPLNNHALNSELNKHPYQSSLQVSSSQMADFDKLSYGNPFRTSLPLMSDVGKSSYEIPSRAEHIQKPSLDQMSCGNILQTEPALNSNLNNLAYLNSLQTRSMLKSDPDKMSCVNPFQASAAQMADFDKLSYGNPLRFNTVPKPDSRPNMDKLSSGNSFQLEHSQQPNQLYCGDTLNAQNSDIRRVTPFASTLKPVDSAFSEVKYKSADENRNQIFGFENALKNISYNFPQSDISQKEPNEKCSEILKKVGRKSPEPFSYFSNNFVRRPIESGSEGNSVMSDSQIMNPFNANFEGNRLFQGDTESQNFCFSQSTSGDEKQVQMDARRLYNRTSGNKNSNCLTPLQFGSVSSDVFPNKVFNGKEEGARHESVSNVPKSTSRDTVPCEFCHNSVPLLELLEHQASCSAKDPILDIKHFPPLGKSQNLRHSKDSPKSSTADTKVGASSMLLQNEESQEEENVSTEVSPRDRRLTFNDFFKPNSKVISAKTQLSKTKTDSEDVEASQNSKENSESKSSKQQKKKKTKCVSYGMG